MDVIMIKKIDVNTGVHEQVYEIFYFIKYWKKVLLTKSKQSSLVLGVIQLIKHQILASRHIDIKCSPTCLLVWDRCVGGGGSLPTLLMLE